MTLAQVSKMDELPIIPSRPFIQHKNPPHQHDGHGKQKSTHCFLGRQSAITSGLSDTERNIIQCAVVVLKVYSLHNELCLRLLLGLSIDT